MNNELQRFDVAVPDQAMKMAEVLQRFVKEKNLTSNIKGKLYPLVEAWQFAGSQLGLYPIVVDVTNLSTEHEYKYGARVEVRRYDDDKVISNGFAICSNKEQSKRQFDEYAIMSMAQTRATGKAYRNLLAWLMKAAGFEATPAEEMDFQPVKPKLTDNALHAAIKRIQAGEAGIYDKLLASFNLTDAQIDAVETAIAELV